MSAPLDFEESPVLKRMRGYIKCAMERESATAGCQHPSEKLSKSYDMTTIFCTVCGRMFTSQQAKESNMSEKYNGYTNYETWNVAMWIGNDQGLYHHCRELATDIKDRIQNAEVGDSTQLKDGAWTAEQATRFLLADAIKATLSNHPLANDAAMYSDLMNHALGQVDWHEVADSVLEQ